VFQVYTGPAIFTAWAKPQIG